MSFIVDDSSVLPVGKSTDILVWSSRDNLLDDLFALASYDHVNVRAALEQIFNFLCCFVASNNCTNPRGELRQEGTDILKSGFPSDADTYKIDLIPYKFAECLRVLKGALMSKVEKGYLTD